MALVEEARITNLLIAGYVDGAYKYNQDPIFHAAVRFAARIVAASHRGDEQTVMGILEPNRAQEKVKCTCHWQSSNYCLVHRDTL